MVFFEELGSIMMICGLTAHFINFRAFSPGIRIIKAILWTSLYYSIFLKILKREQNCLLFLQNFSQSKILLKRLSSLMTGQLNRLFQPSDLFKRPHHSSYSVAVVSSILSILPHSMNHLIATTHSPLEGGRAS